jgi:hypothetical protein
VTLVIQAGVQVLFLANSDDQSSGQRLSDSELLVKGTLSVLGTADAPVVLSSSNAVAAAGDWGGIYLETNADLTLTYAHLSYTGYGINSANYIDSVKITHSRLEFSGDGIRVRYTSGNSLRVITDNVISVTSGDFAIYLQQCCTENSPSPDVSRNTISNTQGYGIYVDNAYSGLTIDANAIKVKSTAVQIGSSGGVISITGNALENTETSSQYWNKGSGISVYSPRANGGSDNAITSVTLQDNTLKGFGGNAALYFDGSNRTITSSVTGNTITDSYYRGMFITNLQGTSITGNTVTGSTNAGVYLQNAVPSAFKDNVITGNGTTTNEPGLYISHSNAELSESFLIEDNDLSGNHIGIELREFANAVVEGNDLSGSTTYGLNNLTTNAIDARYNYWGLVETTTLDEGGHPKALSFIYDGRDDGQYGAVNYAGWQTVSSFAVPDNDFDVDGITNEADNCPEVANANQSDIDADGFGDVCDTDADGDELPNSSDAFPLVSIEGYIDTDGDGRPDDCNTACTSAGMAADTDDDNDGVSDIKDAYPLISLGSLIDTDGDGYPNDCDALCQEKGMIADADDDNDGVLDDRDTYPLASLGELIDTDDDGAPDNCDNSCQFTGMKADTDDDGDAVNDLVDNCPLFDNADQVDSDGDGIGDLCDTDNDNDFDKDGITNELDNCPQITNVDQFDVDGDGAGDVCDTDSDGDGLLNDMDRFPLVSIEGYEDTDADGWPDDCGLDCLNVGMTADSDDDNDGVEDTKDGYPLISLGELIDTDKDGYPDICDASCQSEGMTADSDDDNDGVPDDEDAYPTISLGNLIDTDDDGAPDNCDDFCRLTGMAADVDDDGDLCLDEQDAFPFDPKRCQAGSQKAIVVAGGGPYAGNYLWPATEAMAEFAISSLGVQGIPRKDIFYLSAGFGNQFVPDDEATKETVQAALLEWTQTDNSADEVLLYLVDHGGPGVFELDQKETLAAQTLNQWLDELQSEISGAVTVVYDACESGSFNPVLASNDYSRLIISSADAGQPALFAANGKVSFSQSFWSTYLVSGDLFRSYVAGSTAIRFIGQGRQQAKISADGDAEANTKADRDLARQFQFGQGIQLASDLPEIGAVSDTLTLTGDSSAELFAYDVSGTTPVTRVWAVVNSPDEISGPADTPILSVSEFDLFDQDGDGTWTGEYKNFDVKGDYEIQFFAVNEAGYSSIPTDQNTNRTVVIQTAGREPVAGRDSDQDGVIDVFDVFPLDPTYSADLDGDLIPDAVDADADGDGRKDDRSGPDLFEPDNSIASASFIALSALPQTHDFTDPADTDHVWFYAEQGVGYEILAYPTRDQQETGPDLQIQLFYADGESYSKDIADEYYGGESERYVFTPSMSGIYIAEVTQSRSVRLEERLEGPRTEYELSLRPRAPRYSGGEVSVETTIPNYVALDSPTRLRFEIKNLGVAPGQYQARILLPVGATAATPLLAGCQEEEGTRFIACTLGELTPNTSASQSINLVFSEEAKRAELVVTVFDGGAGKVFLDANNVDNSDLSYLVVTRDEDADGLPDEYELRKGLDPSSDDAAQDFDGDGISNLKEYFSGTDPTVFDEDQDGDGYVDASDLFPENPNEWADGDLDGIGDNSDVDDDNDGFEDSEDAFPFDANEHLDTDSDGLGNNADTDDDGDGVPDVEDAYPQISLEGRTDTDGDGFPDSCDEACQNIGMVSDQDDDNDGFNDADDAFPLDSSETSDADGDGIGDNADADDDNDGFSDEEEAKAGTDPLSAGSCPGCFSWDIDNDGDAKALTDGLIVIRHLFGFSGDSLTAGAIGGSADRTDAADISSFLEISKDELDIDGDGDAKALTDGLLLIRSLFGFSGDSLIAGAIGTGAARDAPDAIAEYIDQRMP